METSTLTLIVSILVLIGIGLCYTKFRNYPNRLLIASMKEDLSTTDPEVIVGNFQVRVSSKLQKYAEDNPNLGRLNGLICKFIRTQYAKKYLIKILKEDMAKESQKSE